MLQLETQKAGTGEWFPVIIFTPGDDKQREDATRRGDVLTFVGLFSRITETHQGGLGLLPASELPANCVSLECFPNFGDREPTNYWGEVIEETDKYIKIRVGDPGETITRLKNIHTRITRSLA